MDNKILPLGTVIRVKEKKERYVIIGRRVIKDDKNYDYLCVTYPYGFNDLIDFLYINDEEVTSMYFLGNINY